MAKKVASIFFVRVQESGHSEVFAFDLIREDGSVFPSGYSCTYPKGRLELAKPLTQEEAGNLGDLLIKADLVDRILY